MKEKLANLIKGVAMALLYILVFLASQVILTFAAAFVTVFTGSDILNLTNNVGIISMFSALMSLGIYLVSFYLRGKDINKVIKTKNTSFLDALFAFAMAIGFRLLTGAYMLWAEGVPALQQSIEEAQAGYNMELMTGFDMIFLLIAVCIIAPAIEELIFRCIVFEELNNCMPAFFAILLQGIAFGIVHMVLAQSIFTAVVGVVLGAVYYKTKNVVITVLVHLFFNCSVVIEIKDYSMIPQTVIVGLIMTVVSFIMFYVLHRKRSTNS